MGANPPIFRPESNRGGQAIPGEVKHLSNRRKRKRIDSVSSGERKRKSPNRGISPGVVGPDVIAQQLGEADGKPFPRG